MDFHKIRYFSKIYQENSNFIQIRQK
jgi:hypothetical protein